MAPLLPEHVFLGSWRKLFELLKEELYDWEEVLDVEKSFLFAVTLFLLVNHLQKEILNQQEHFFSVHGIDYLDSTQYDHTYSVFTWLSSTSESVQSWTIVLKFLFRLVVFKFLLFINSSNV